MPYRRLPNTDNARHKALIKAYEKGKDTPPFKLAFSQSTYQKIVSFLPGFEKKIIHQRSALSKQIERNKDYHSLQKKAKLYISHFIQVVNMAIQRGESEFVDALGQVGFAVFVKPAELVPVPTDEARRLA